MAELPFPVVLEEIKEGFFNAYTLLRRIPMSQKHSTKNRQENYDSSYDEAEIYNSAR